MDGAPSRAECRFDHLVIGAKDLAAGAAWSRETFAREIPMGGAHPAMGTHNRLARLAQAGPADSGYLEIIAADPSAQKPPQPRWFGLDDKATQARLAKGPRPLAFVLAVADIEGARAAAKAAGYDPGEIREASRGDLAWRITVPKDGRVPRGVLPSLISWTGRTGAPVERMADVGLSLRQIHLKCADVDVVARALDALGAEDALARAGIVLKVLSADGEPHIEAMMSGPAFGYVLIR